MGAPLNQRAQARVGEEVVADSDAALRVDGPDGPSLWFPRTSATDDALAGDDPLGWPGRGDLAEHVTFDPARVQLEVVDVFPPGEARDVTRKRFPCWGDVADLVRVMDVQPLGDGRYQGAVHTDGRRPVVEGSQLLGQSIIAASRHAPRRRAVFASMAFVRPVDAGAPFEIELDEVTGGRTFSGLRTTAVQGGRVGAFGTVLLDVTAPSVIEHSDPAPEVPGPYESVPYDMTVLGRDLRIVDGAYTGDPDAPVGPPELSAWVRFRDLPGDEPIHAGLLVQFTGHLSIAAALRAHAGVGEDQAHRSLSTAINAISVSLHGPIDAERWMLYHHRSVWAGDGMTHAVGQVHDESGRRLASFTVEAMARGFGEGGRTVDERTAL